MHDWIEHQLEKKKAPMVTDPRVRLEAILARSQTRTRKEKKPKVQSHIIANTSGSRMIHIATLVMDKGKVVGGE